MQNLVSRAKFADMAEVNPSTVTRVCKTVLQAAISGDMIDAAHPDAVAYVAKQAKKATPPAAEGLDPVYEEALQVCRETGRFTANNVQTSLGIGWARAKRIVEVMKATGIIDSEGKPDPKRAEQQVPTKLRGQAGAKERKKRAVPDEQEPIEIPSNIRDFMDMTIMEIVQKFGTDYRFVDWLKAAAQIEGIEEKRLKNAQSRGNLISRDLVQKGVIDQINNAHLRLLKDGVKTISAGAMAKVGAGAEQQDVEAYVSDIVGSYLRPVKSRMVRALEDA